MRQYQCDPAKQRKQYKNTTFTTHEMARTSSDDSRMFQLAGGLSLMQLAITMAIVSYYNDPHFSMYTTQLLNTTTKQMEVEVEDFSASVLYLGASAFTTLFAMASRNRTNLSFETHYTVEALEEVPMWDLTFWLAQMLQHACLVAFMCSPLDWYFLVLTVFGISFLLLFITRLPLVSGGRSRENILLLLFGMLYFTLYTAVRVHGHVVFFVTMLFLDALLLVGHTFDADPNMQVIGNCRLCYCASMSVLLMASYVSV
jgi:hypothetical protein